ncbi:MAG: histidine phosphatase family protein [Roseicyclus sp.]|jgi:phosphohistidine phosphatase
MPLKLILTRHAKSDWGDPMLQDRDRSLNARGRRDAPRIGAWLAAQGHLPGQALVSAATRTRETWMLLSAEFGREVPVTFLDQLYHAEGATLLATLQAAHASAVMIVGHNPGISEAAYRLVSMPPSHGRFIDYPTCATLVCAFAVDTWDQVSWGMGDVVDFVTPHDV